jgi:hypothetical protein
VLSVVPPQLAVGKFFASATTMLHCFKCNCSHHYGKRHRLSVFPHTPIPHFLSGAGGKAPAGAARLALSLNGSETEEQLAQINSVDAVVALLDIQVSVCWFSVAACGFAFVSPCPGLSACVTLLEPKCCSVLSVAHAAQSTVLSLAWLLAQTTCVQVCVVLFYTLSG